jgi:hypothetical protein
MNEESRPARRLPDNNILAATIQDAGDGSSERAFIEAVRGKASDTPDSRTNGYKPASEAENVVQDATRTVPGQAPSLAYEPRILERFLDDLRLSGVAGEERLAQLTYLALTSRVLPWGKPTNRPVSIIAKGTTSTGKSHTTQTVLRFFPPSAFLDLGSMSKRYLLYADDPLSHRVIVVPEWSSVANDDELVTTVRTLLSEGRLVHGTVEGDNRRQARRIEKDGPTGLLITTTAAHVDPELETRCLAVLTDDSPEQTRAVYLTLAELEDEDECPVHFESWHELQSWLGESGETRVQVPYVAQLAKLMPTTATRLRRDFVSLLCLVRAHALLHQLTRERDDRGRIIAAVDDYAAVRELVAELVAEGADASVSETTRETVEAVSALLDEGAEYVTAKPLIDRLEVGRSATYDRVRRALAGGYLQDQSKRNERGYRLVLGSTLPGHAGFLPEPEALVVQASSERPPDEETAGTGTDSDTTSGSPARPAWTEV